jgi:hypothetical protein
MRKTPLLIAALFSSTLAACAGGSKAFATDFAAAKANATTLEGGAFAHSVGQHVSTPGLVAAAKRCTAGGASTPASHRGLLEFERSRGYTVRFDPDDEQATCLAKVYANLSLPEPPARPYLVPIEVGATR